MDNFKFKIIFLFFIICSSISIAQEQEIEIANEYFLNKEYFKAKLSYEKALKIDNNRFLIYDNYLSTLIELKEYNTAEKFIIKTKKKNSVDPKFSIDLILLYTNLKKVDLSDKEFNKLKSKCNLDEEYLIKSSNYLNFKNQYNLSLDLYISARDKSNDRFKYSFQIIEIYKFLGKIDLMIDELLDLLKQQQNGDMLIVVQNTLQSNLTHPDDFDKLETKLLKNLQVEPDNSQLVELISWLYIQRKDFYKAYIQSKAFDKRNKLEGVKMIEIGLIAFKNNDFQNSSLIFDYVKTEYPNGANFNTAMYYSIKVKESLIKTTYPVDKLNILNLIKDYQQYLSITKQNSTQIEIKKSMALLYAFNLGDVDKSIKILEEIILITKDINMLAKLKIDLADVKLLKNDIWDASLLYSQAEKLVKDSPLGYEAKFKNAKLFYYKGEFLLAQEQLNVLKQATTREISNDAIQLSVFIQDQLLADSVSDILLDYSKIELLIFKNEYTIALNKLDSLLITYPQDKITDDVYWLQSKVYIKINQYENAVKKLKLIVDNYSQDIYGDDAYFMLAELYEEKLNKKEEAKILYESLLEKYPGSIFVAESRKRFRLLRGDKL